MRPIFRDDAYQDHLDRFGWVKFPFLSDAEVNELLVRSREIVPTFAEGFKATFHMSPEVKAAVADTIKSAFAPRIANLLLGDYRTISTTLFSKKGIGKGEIPMHQHISYTDEANGVSAYTVWVPLVDTDESNGNLHVVSGTHRLRKFPRAVYLTSDDLDYYSPACWRLFEERSQAVPMKAGEALVFENSLLHGSPPSRTDDMRIVAAAVIVPIEAETFMYSRAEDGRLAICALEEVVAPDLHDQQSKDPERVLGYVEVPDLDGLEEQVFLALDAEPPTHRNQAPVKAGKEGISGWARRILGMSTK